MERDRRAPGPDRRKHARGGRRPSDPPGYSPLVMVIESNVARRDVTEAILAKLKFAVVPVESVERALAISKALRPTVIVCPRNEASKLPGNLPVVTMTEDSEVLLENIRAAIRVRVGATTT